MEQRTSPSFTSQSGGAIWIILFSIMVFVALVFAVTQSMRVSGSNTGKWSKENLDLQYANTMNLLEAVKTRYIKLTMIDKIPALNVSFQNDVYQNVNGTSLCYNNNSACTNTACYIFQPYAPDGVRPIELLDITTDTTPSAPTYQKNGSGLVGQISIDGLGTTNPEPFFRIFGISPEFCNYFNARNGLTTNYDMNTKLSDIGETTSSSQGNTWPASCGGAAAWSSTPDVFGEEATMFRGRMAFCAPARLNAANVRLAITYILQAR